MIYRYLYEVFGTKSPGSGRYLDSKLVRIAIFRKFICVPAFIGTGLPEVQPLPPSPFPLPQRLAPPSFVLISPHGRPFQHRGGAGAGCRSTGQAAGRPGIIRHRSQLRFFFFTPPGWRGFWPAGEKYFGAPFCKVPRGLTGPRGWGGGS